MTDASGTLQYLLESLSHVRTRKVAGGQSPHKFVFLLALLRLYEADANRPNRFYLKDYASYCTSFA